MTEKPGTLVEAFTLIIDGREIDAQIRLVHAADGTEMLDHYEDDFRRLTHPARRCTDCTGLLLDGSAGGWCYTCADGLHLDTEQAPTYTSAKVGEAANRAANLIQEHLDQEADELAWSLVNVMVAATDHLLANPDATLTDIFVNHFDADPDDPEAVMVEYGMA